MDQPENGLTDDVLKETDVLIWWGHKAHNEVSDAVVEKVYTRVMEGMGFIALHSAHHSKVFKKLNGTTCNLKWRDKTFERIFNIQPPTRLQEGFPIILNWAWKNVTANFLILLARMT